MNNFYKFTAQADTQKPARLDLYGAVGGGYWEEGFDENTFKNDMSVVPEDQALDIYINSNGGSVFTAIAIYNIIARHKGVVTIRVDGMAASAATIITSVPNAQVVMPLGAMMLVHPVRLSTGSMTPEELKKAAENLEKVRASVVDIYAKKTCKPKDELLALMSEESYLTAEEAVELGFADSVDETASVTNEMLGDVVMVNGLSVSADLFAHAPKEFIKAVTPKASAVLSPTNKLKEEEKMDLEKLKADYPELVEAIRNEAKNEGISQERARILAIEEIAIVGHEEMVQEAKFKTAMTAEQLAVAILKADKARNAKMLSERATDAKEVSELPTDGNTGIVVGEEAKQKEEAERKAVIEAGARAFRK